MAHAIVVVLGGIHLTAPLQRCCRRVVSPPRQRSNSFVATTHRLLLGEVTTAVWVYWVFFLSCRLFPDTSLSNGLLLMCPFFWATHCISPLLPLRCTSVRWISSCSCISPSSVCLSMNTAHLCWVNVILFMHESIVRSFVHAHRRGPSLALLEEVWI